MTTKVVRYRNRARQCRHEADQYADLAIRFEETHGPGAYMNHKSYVECLRDYERNYLDQAARFERLAERIERRNR